MGTNKRGKKEGLRSFSGKGTNEKQQKRALKFIDYAVIFFILLGLIALVYFLKPSITEHAIYDQTNQSDFDEGTYNNTDYNGNAIVLSSGQTSGNYTSQVFNAGSSSSWNNISWMQGGYYQQELPDNKGIENGLGGANMTDNMLLMHMNEESGIIVDTSGQGNNGTANGGVTYGAEGKLNTALSFDGADDYINCGNDTDFNFSNKDFTISFWIHPNWTGIWHALIVKRKDYDVDNDWGIWYHSTNHMEFIYGNDVHIILGTPPSKNVWTHVVVVRSGTNLTMYKDGVAGTPNPLM